MNAAMAKVNGFFETAQEGPGIWSVRAAKNLAVAFQRFRVDRNIPSAAAGVGTVFADAMEIMVIGREFIGHRWVLSFLNVKYIELYFLRRGLARRKGGQDKKFWKNFWMRIDLYRQNRDYDIKCLIKFCILKILLCLILSDVFAKYA